jgi:hypothetical protein
MDVTLKEAGDLLPLYFDAGISVELISCAGVGKSDKILQLRQQLSERDGFEWGYAEMFLATMTPSDLLGYLMPETKIIDGKEVRVSSWTLPLWKQTKDGKPLSAYRRGILFLDEYGQGEGDVKRGSSQLLLKGEVGPHKLDDGWVIVAASNRSSDRSGVTKSFDFVINRRAELHIVPDVDSWVEWANTAGVSPTTITFARKNPHIVFDGKVPEKQGPWCTPRSLVMADKMIRAMSSQGDISENMLAMKTVISLIGEAAARQYFVFLKLETEVPDVEDIVADPNKVKVPDKIDVQMLTAYHLAHMVKLDTLAPIAKYMERFDQEFGVTFLKAAVERDKTLARSPVFLDWCKKNSALMASVR